jgi:hypothetical protein
MFGGISGDAAKRGVTLLPAGSARAHDGLSHPSMRETAMMMVIGAVSAALLLGFVAGLVTFRKAQRWCPGCGRGLACPDRHCRQSGATAVRA